MSDVKLTEVESKTAHTLFADLQRANDPYALDRAIEAVIASRGYNAITDDFFGSVESARNRLLVTERIHATHLDLWPGAQGCLEEHYRDVLCHHPLGMSQPTVVKILGMEVREDATVRPGEFRLAAPVTTK